MKYFKLSDISNDLTAIRDNGWVKGLTTGFANLDPFFTLKKGYPLFVAGAPYAGKSEFVLELLVKTSRIHKWKHFIYMGEGGEVKDLFAELCYKFIGKPYYKNFPNSMDEKEKIYAEMWVDEHFILCNQDDEMTIEEFYNVVSEAEKSLGIKFDTTLFDPFNDIKDEAHLFGNRDDKWLNVALKTVRNASKKNNRIDILIEHIADIAPVTDKSTGNRYIPPALPSEWAKGRTWWRRAFTMILIYRPPVFLTNDNGEPHKENETHIIIQKSKPKGIGKLGRAVLFYDWKTNRYYENESLEVQHPHPDKLIEPNKEFLNPF